jgi:hypothetical protein
MASSSPASRSDDPAFDRRAGAGCDGGVTACEPLVAQTGSILVLGAHGPKELFLLLVG